MARTPQPPRPGSYVGGSDDFSLLDTADGDIGINQDSTIPEMGWDHSDSEFRRPGARRVQG